MPVVTITLDGTTSGDHGTRLAQAKASGKLIDASGQHAKAIEFVVMPEGMKSGRPSVLIIVEMPDGQTLVTETSALMLVQAGKAIAGCYPGLGLA